MRALSIRQPYAELILRGIKTIEFRSRPTRIIGQRFHIYAGLQWAAGKLFLEGCGVPAEPSMDHRPLSIGEKAWSTDLAVPGIQGHAAPQPWMLELARMLILKDLPMGVIVGSAVIDHVTQHSDGLYQWHLKEVSRAKRLRKPTGRPQPVWFNV
jgi:hypothetical protein